MTNATWGGNGLIDLPFYITIYHGKKLGADTEAMEGCCSLPSSPGLTQPVFLENQGLPAQGLPHPQ